MERGGTDKTAAATEAQQTRQTMEGLETETGQTRRAETPTSGATRTGKAAVPTAFRRRQLGQPAVLTPTAWGAATAEAAEV